MKIAVLVSGNGSNLQALLDSDLRQHIELVVSNNGQAPALGRADRAEVRSLVLTRRSNQDREDYDFDLASRLNEQGIELVVLAGWMHILSEGYLSNFEGQTINLHPALPGEYPGLNAIERAFKDGREETGCMVHRVIREVDAGEVLGTAKVTIDKDDNLQTLSARMHQAEHKLLVQVVRGLVSSRAKLS